MSAANFRTQSGFPLYCFDDTGMEWWEAQEYFDDMNSALEDVNNDLEFFQIELASGYYCGVQFIVNISRYADEAGFTEDGAEYADNESCRYYLDMCLSEAKRKFEAERRKVLRLMKKTAEAWGFREYVCVAHFSNGEALYDLASNRRATLKAAAMA